MAEICNQALNDSPFWVKLVVSQDYLFPHWFYNNFIAVLLFLARISKDFFYQKI